MKKLILFLAFVANAILINAQSTYVASFGIDTYGGPSSTVKSGTKLFFSAYDPVHGRELWCTNGTPAGTYMVKDINPGINNGIDNNFFELTAYDMKGVLYFRGNDGVTGTELWRSDGTAAGTYLVKDLYPGTGNSSIGYFAAVGNTLYFTANTGSALWKTDGTTAGTVFIRSFSIITNLCGYKNKLYFAADDNNSGQELWKSGGTAATTAKLKDLNGAFGASLPCNFYATGNALYFTASTASGWELWKTTGTAASTVMVKDINPGGNGTMDTYSEAFMTNIGNTLYFRAQDGVHGYQLWKTDGTAANTVMCTNLANGVDYYCKLPIVDGKVMVTNYALTNWWQYDPVSNTSSATNYPSSYYLNVYPNKSAFVGNNLCYLGKDTIYGPEMWISNGTVPGTRMLQETHLADNYSYYPIPGFNSVFGVIGNRLFFTLAKNATSLGVPLYVCNTLNAYNCFPPSIVVPVHISNTVAHVVWNRTANTTQYRFRYRKAGTTPWTVIISTHSYCELTGLTANTDYEYQVGSYCSGSWTGYSPVATYNTGTVLNDYVTHIVAERSEDATTERIYWIKTPQIDKIQIRYRVSGTTTWTTVTSANGYKQLTGLAPNAFYEYQTRMNFGGSWEPWSSITYNLRYFVTSGTANIVSRMTEEEIIAPDDVDVYPNPTTGMLHIKGFTEPDVRLTVMDNTGRIVKSEVVSDNQFDISDLPQGMYIVSMKSGEKTVVRKIIKQ